MILDLAKVFRWEWFKLRRRWMPYVLLAVMVLITQVSIWATILAYNDARTRSDTVYFEGQDGAPLEFDCYDVVEGRADLSQAGELEPMIVDDCQDWDRRRQENVQNMYDIITPPGSASFTMSIGQSIGLILAAILIASLVGTEHGWGTMRFVLVRGVRRWHVLASKLGAAWLAFAAALLLIGVLGTIAGQIIDGLLSGAEELENGTPWGSVTELYGRSLLAVLPYVALVALVTVATRSSAAGIGIGVGYYFLEQTVVGIFGAFFDWFQNIAEFLPVYIMQAYAAEGGGISIGGGGGESSEYAGDVHALLVMAAYTLVAGALAFYLVHRRDVGGASRG